MENITNVLDCFPHPEFREGQPEVLERIISDFDRGYDNVMLEMPTGGGKSSIAFTIAKFLQNSYIITPQKILQDQYNRDIDLLDIDAAVLEGKGNYNCIEQLGKKCDECLLTLNKKCDSRGGCVYYKHEENAISSDMTILNFHILRALDVKLYSKCENVIEYNENVKRNVLIIDEAHTLESFLMDLISVNIPVFDNVKFKCHSLKPSSVLTQDTIKLIVDGALVEYVGRLSKVLSEIEKDNGDTTKLIKNRNTIMRQLEKLNHLYSNIDNGNWAFIKKFEEKEFKCLVAKPVNVGPYSNLILRTGTKKLFMSATLPTKEVFCRSLGINPQNTVKITTPNNFPRDTRKIYSLSPTNGSYLGITYRNNTKHGTDTVYNPLFKIVSNIINSEYCLNKKGLIITHNNAILNSMMKALSQRDNERLIVCASSLENSDDGIIDKRVNAINEHKKSDDASILIGPWLYEGLDLKYDLACFVIVFKCPYPYEDAQIKLKRDNDPQWYNNTIALKLIQGVGRGSRAKDDFCMNFFIDPSINQFVSGRGYDFIPQYIHDVISPMPKCFL